MDDYDVFLNHRGPDVKGGFVAHLDEALRSAGLNPFLDKSSLVKGDPAYKSIDAALEVAKVHVAVVSRGYVESKHCLIELAAMMRSGKPVIPVFYDVEPGELRWVEKGPFAAALEKHKSREPAKRVQEWADALHSLAVITGFMFRLSDYKGDEAELKREVVDAIQRSLPSRDALQIRSKLLGLEWQVRICINVMENMSHEPSLLGIVGMGGIGKTTLAKEIYDRFVGCKRFQAMTFLEIDRSSPSSTEVGPSFWTRLQKQLVWDLLHVRDIKQQNYRHCFPKLSGRGPVLIVLDDIQDQLQFDKLIPSSNHLAPGSCIIVTSRDRHLLKLVGRESKFYLHEVTPLGCEDSRKLFNWHAFRNEEAPENFKAAANDVSKACGGLPLALKVVGSSLFDKISDDDRQTIWPEAIKALKRDKSIMGALKWSYDCLQEVEKLMFLDIACVFCGWEKEEAMKIWQSCEDCLVCCGNGTPNISLRNLIDKSLVVVAVTNSIPRLAMHNLLQDMGRDIGIDDGSHLWKGNIKRATAKDVTKVRALDLANGGRQHFDFEDFAKMQNLHFMVLDGCHVSGNLTSISNELRCLRWRNIPQRHIPPMLKILSNLVSLDFSQSTQLASIWAESDTTLFEACPNLQSLDLTECTSITTLPDSLGRLSRLQVLDLDRCKNLQKLPSSIGQLTALEELRIQGCRRLEALPDTITTLPRLQKVAMYKCSSISKLPATFGLLSSLTDLLMDLATKWQAVAIAQLSAVKSLLIQGGTDEAISMIDTLGALKNHDQLCEVWLEECPSMTKLPETIGLLTNLERLSLCGCDSLLELPDSIGQLKILSALQLWKCRSLEILPDSLDALTSLKYLSIIECISIMKLPVSIGYLSSLRALYIHGCSELQSLPYSLKELNALQRLQIMECRSLEGLGVLRVLQGLRIWGCTSITELTVPNFMVVDSNFFSPIFLWDTDEKLWRSVPRNLKEEQVVEVNDCGLLRHVQDDSERRRIILQRVYNSCCKMSLV